MSSTPVKIGPEHPQFGDAHGADTLFPTSRLGLFDSVFHEVDQAIAIVQAHDGDNPMAEPMVVDVNSRFERDMGFSSGEVKGRNLFKVIRLPSGSSSPEVTALQSALANRKTAEVFVTMHTKDNVAMPVQLKLRPCATVDDDRKFVCFLRAESEPEDDGQATREITNRLLTFLSHDLRTPLNGILGFSEIMMSGLVGTLDRADYEDYARDIHNAGQDLLRLVNGLLDLSHSETRGLELSDHLFPVRNWIMASVSAMDTKANAAGVAVEANVEKALPLVRGDEARLRQVLLILLSNAIKFTPRNGRIMVNAHASAGGLEVRVEDTGVGIESHELRCAFLPYRRIEDTYNNPKAGIGVGLPLVKVLMEQHGGSVAIESTRGKGTTVTLRFPPERMVGHEA